MVHVPVFFVDELDEHRLQIHILEPGRVPRQHLDILQSKVFDVIRGKRAVQETGITILHRSGDHAPGVVGEKVHVRIQADIVRGDSGGEIPLLHPGDMGQAAQGFDQLSIKAFLVMVLIGQLAQIEKIYSV